MAVCLKGGTGIPPPRPHRAGLGPALPRMGFREATAEEARYYEEGRLPPAAASPPWSGPFRDPYANPLAPAEWEEDAPAG